MLGTRLGRELVREISVSLKEGRIPEVGNSPRWYSSRSQTAWAMQLFGEQKQLMIKQAQVLLLTGSIVMQSHAALLGLKDCMARHNS